MSLHMKPQLYSRTTSSASYKSISPTLQAIVQFVLLTWDDKIVICNVILTENI